MQHRNGFSVMASRFTSARLMPHAKSLFLTCLRY